MNLEYLIFNFEIIIMIILVLDFIVFNIKLLKLNIHSKFKILNLKFYFKIAPPQDKSDINRLRRGLIF